MHPPRRPLLALLSAAAILLAVGCSAGPGGQPSSSPVPGTPSTGPTSPAAPSSPTPGSSAARPVTPPPVAAPSPSVRPPQQTPLPTRLPLAYPTGQAQQVITVTAPSTASTRATVQAWQRSASGWTAVGAAASAFLGTAGMTAQPSEVLSASPMGSFTITEAFGRSPNPGTRLPYRQTTPADWWISQPGRFYNTWQHCAGACPFTQGEPNEHLYEITPWYDYAVVIDYNRDPVRQGAGSAFFLHVSVGEPTQGCVAVERDRLVQLLRWLDPSAHPRILIGVG